jgi:hypothetical protein
VCAPFFKKRRMKFGRGDFARMFRKAYLSG